ncbi:PREDICTED: uncharacterized protein LOC109132842 [Camelina sativa]|uniref:Uncharacterized protein LOC109132842 n=1 Tax=Camelina sativa TaxID=90675 RepID=A0ABM1RP78_CAMSA|nr:PREDICTED: uncharacterized protein LOC109132842 [Camelina sativa]
MDDMMYILWENASLGRLKSNRAGFMNCMFSMQIKNEYLKFREGKKGHKWDSMILAYANGDLPSHGKTGKKWALDFDKVYAPVNVNNDHWISVCINFGLRTVEVFDCAGLTHRSHVDPFAILIPRFVKEVQTKTYGKYLHVAPYSIIFALVPPNLNKSCCDCGVYALKYIECHMLNLDMSLINDDNIKEARTNITVDLWEAASDPVFIERMEKYEPSSVSHHIVDLS